MKIIKCKSCGELKSHAAYGLCHKCYNKQDYKLHREEKLIKHKQYRESHREEEQQKRESKPNYGGSKTNKDCALYLGVTVAEQVLSHVFKNVQKMPNCNPGFDFICGKGFKIDVKSSCRQERKNNWSNRWNFCINYNIIPDYFLCIAFDNRDDLNPEHIWLIPGNDVNNKSGLSVTESRLNKWSKYEINKLDDIIKCCNIIKGE